MQFRALTSHFGPADRLKTIKATKYNAWSLIMSNLFAGSLAFLEIHKR